MGAVGVAKSGVRLLAAATLLEHGSDLQKRKSSCAASLLAKTFGANCSANRAAAPTSPERLRAADLVGDHWIVNGQKVWTTSAHHADHGLLLARTDWDAPKHEGLSYFVIDIKQPGVDVQPLKQMNGHASFNQVFFTDAIVWRETWSAVLATVGKVAMTTLAHERRGADGLTTPSKRGTRQGRMHAEERAELETANQPYNFPPQRASLGAGP